jgi:hypothetical protein
MTNFEYLKSLVEKNGTEAMNTVVESAEKYIEGFNRIFAERDVSETVLKIDLPMFFKELEETGVFKGKGGMEIKLHMMNVLYVVRHTWELIDNYGKTKTGDDLHKALPLMFEDNEMLSTEKLYKIMESMIC